MKLALRLRSLGHSARGIRLVHWERSPPTIGDFVAAPWQPSRDALPEASRLLIERAHEELIAGNLEDKRLQQVRPLVRESWERSLRGRVGPEAAPGLELATEEIEAYRLSHPLASVMDMIRSLLLGASEEDSGVVIAVGDQAGRLLWVEGDRQVRSLTGDMGFVAGANWAEDAVGTTAPGTALALGQSVQIRGAEHYNRLVHPWSCTAAPVRDPETRRVLGVIDITGGDEVVGEHRETLFDDFLIEPANILLASEYNPFEAYKQIYTAMAQYKRALKTMGGCKLFVSPLSSKLLSIGVLLACYDHRYGAGSDEGFDVGIPYVETAVYGDPEQGPEQGFGLHSMWIRGDWEDALPFPAVVEAEGD